MLICFSNSSSIIKSKFRGESDFTIVLTPCTSNRITGCGETELCEDNSVERHESVAAVIPAMIIDNREKETKFISKNGSFSIIITN